MSAEVNQPTITEYKAQLIETPLSGWIDFIELNKARLNVMDADSIQSFLDKLTEAYGEVDQ